MRCPICSRDWPYEKTGLLELERRVRETGCTYGEGWTRSLSESEIWACPECLGNGRAIPADPAKQDFGGLGSPPFLAYRDHELQCKYCGVLWTFTADEQVFWYETCGFHVQAYPTGCKGCRRIIRTAKEAQKRLMELIPALNPDDADQLEEVAELQLQTGNVKRALEFLRRAKKRARDGAKRLSLEKRIADLLAQRKPTTSVPAPALGISVESFFSRNSEST